MDFSQIMKVLNSEDGLREMMKQDAFEGEDGNTFSQADLICDLIIIQRMDIKRLAKAVSKLDDCDDVDVSVNQMTPDHAAGLLQGIAKGEDLGLIEVFDEIEDHHMSVLAAIEGEEAVEEYMEMKQKMLHTHSTEEAEA